MRLIDDRLRETTLIFHQILPNFSLSNCEENILEMLYVKDDENSV